MLLPAIAIAAIHLFSAALLSAASEAPWGLTNSVFSVPHEILSIKNIQGLKNRMIDFATKTIVGAPGEQRQIPLDHCAQVQCEDSNSILYCNHVS